MYRETETPYVDNDDDKRNFCLTHDQSYCIAVSAALLYQDFLEKKELNLHIRGEKNKYIPIYNTVSKALVRVPKNKNEKASNYMKSHGKTYLADFMPEGLRKYLTTRYSISVFGLSDFFPSQDGAYAHLKVRKMKLELQKDAYEFLKEMSINEATETMGIFCRFVDYGRMRGLERQNIK